MPAHPEDALRTSHNFDAAGSELSTGWYRGGIRAATIAGPTARTALVHDTPGAQNRQSDGFLDPYDVLGPTMREPLRGS